MKTAPRLDAQLAAAHAELAELERDDWFGMHAQAQAQVCRALTAFNARRDELEAAGITGVRLSRTSDLSTVAAPLRSLRADLDKALAERQRVEAVCQRINSLRKIIENGGSTHAQFRSFSADRLTPEEARHSAKRLVRGKDGKVYLQRIEDVEELREARIQHEKELERGRTRDGREDVYL